MTAIDTTGTEIVPTPERTLFRTDDPVEVLAAARTVAEALKAVLDDNDMVVRIRGKGGRVSEHVTLEGWQTVGAMLGISPHVIWSTRITGEGWAGWEARAEARTADGRVVGAAEGMVTSTERNWKAAEDYAMRSMAQTRAMSKALSAPLRFVVTLAGKSGTPAEEAGGGEEQRPYGPAANDAESAGVGRAVHGLWTDPATGEVKVDPVPLFDKLVEDAGGYLPRVVARAIMFVAAHNPNDPRQSTARPGGAETGTDGDGVPEQDVTATGEIDTPETAGEDYADTDAAQDDPPG